MKIIKWIVIVIIILIALAAAYLALMGAFNPIKVEEKVMGPMVVVYTDYKGDYSKVGPVMEKFSDELIDKYKINPAKGIGIYLDNPKQVKSENLRSKLGFILDASDSQKIAAIKKEYKVMTLKKANYATAQFPFKNKLSIIIGVIKVYPQLQRYMQAKNYKMTPALEVYEMGKTITYAFEIKK